MNSQGQEAGRAGPPGGRPSRRAVLRGAGLAGAGVAVGGLAPPSLAATGGTGSRLGDDDPRFTLVVVPDTQYLFDADRGDPEPLEAALWYVVEHRSQNKIVFTAHLGDIVENAAAHELAAASRVFRVFDRHRVPYSVLAGNHDIDPRTDDQRGPSPYLEEFGPHRFRRLATYGGATANGSPTPRTADRHSGHRRLLALRPATG
jgi:hypothetical protein